MHKYVHGQCPLNNLRLYFTYIWNNGPWLMNLLNRIALPAKQHAFKIPMVCATWQFFPRVAEFFHLRDFINFVCSFPSNNWFHCKCCGNVSAATENGQQMCTVCDRDNVCSHQLIILSARDYGRCTDRTNILHAARIGPFYFITAPCSSWSNYEPYQTAQSMGKCCHLGNPFGQNSSATICALR